MKIDIREDQLSASLDAPKGGGTVRVTDGDKVLYEGPVSGKLSVDVDAVAWGVPEAMRDLLSVRLPPQTEYDPNRFKPLATPYIGLATCRVSGSPPLGTWTHPAVISGQMLPLSAMAGTIHYAQSVFEGSKVYFVKDARGRCKVGRMFRPKRNVARMWDSAKRMGIPLDMTEMDGRGMSPSGFADLYERMVHDVVRANVADGLFDGLFQPLDLKEQTFEETPPALYVRPVLFGSGPVLGVKPADHYSLVVYVTPAGKYRADLVLRIERTHPRAYPGGTGAVKAACNYAPTLQMMSTLKDNRMRASDGAPWTDIYDDILFVDRHIDVDEVGGANFFVLREMDGEMVLRTPPSRQESQAADTILPGITRDAILKIARVLGITVRVEPIPLSELFNLNKHEAKRAAVFATGTAAGIAPVVALNDAGLVRRFAYWDDVHDDSRRRHLDKNEGPEGSALWYGRLLRRLLFRIQLGDYEGIKNEVGGRGADVLTLVERDRWIESFDL